MVSRVSPTDGGVVVLAGGGSGGHLVPGVGLARAIQARGDDSLRVIFYSTGRPLEGRLISRVRCQHREVPAHPVPGRLVDLPRWIWRQAASLARAWGQVSQDRPRVVVGLGGFGAAAPVLAAWMRGIPTVLLEQNVIPGRANRLLAPLASEIHLQWEETRDHFQWHPGLCATGSPLGQELQGRANGQRVELLEGFGLQPDRHLLLATGGSQGARSLNRHMAGAMQELGPAMRGRLQILHLAGAATPVEELRACYAELGIPHRVVEFLEEMPLAYAIADLVICRAGGTTLAELAAAGLPALMLPYPYATNRHQHANAEAFSRRGAGVVLDEGGLTPARLAREVEGILLNPVRRQEMARAALTLARPMAGFTIAQRIERLALGESAR